MKKLNLGNINAGLNSLKAATDNAAQNGRFELIDTAQIDFAAKNSYAADDNEESYKLITLGPLKAFLTHGHRYAVRGGKLDVLLYAVECCGAQIAMFGHTHRALFDQIGGIFVLNPGTAGKAPRRTWAKLEITPDGTVSCDICDIVS